MKKVVFLVLAGMLSAGALQAQSGKAFYNSPYKSRNSGSFSKSTGILSFGLGGPNKPVGYWNGYGYSSHSGLPVLYGKYEHGIIDEVGIGGELAITGGSYKYGGNNEKAKITAFHLAVMGYYHFNKLIPVKQLDVYAGAGLALRNRAVNNAPNGDDSATDVTIPVKVGARYYFTNSFGAYLETGYDNMSDVNVGVSFRF